VKCCCPIIHNKLFIFGNVEFTRERISASSSGKVVPNNNELAGNFSQICASNRPLPLGIREQAAVFQGLQSLQRARASTVAPKRFAFVDGISGDAYPAAGFA
jgi:hypothetical protein